MFKPGRSCLSTIPSRYTSNMNTGTHEIARRSHFGDFLFCGCVCLFVPSSSKRYENRGSMTFATRKGHGEEQSKTLIGTKSSPLRGWSYFLVGACGPENTTKIGVFSGLRTHGREQRVSKKKPGVPINLCVFFSPKFFTENRGVFFSGTPEISAQVFFPGSGSFRVMRPKPLKKEVFGMHRRVA